MILLICYCWCSKFAHRW